MSDGPTVGRTPLSGHFPALRLCDGFRFWEVQACFAAFGTRVGGRLNTPADIQKNMSGD